MTVVDSPVGLVEEAGAVQKVAEARSFEAVLPPGSSAEKVHPNFPRALRTSLPHLRDAFYTDLALRTAKTPPSVVPV
jgi:hypothetical protein